MTEIDEKFRTADVYGGDLYASDNVDSGSVYSYSIQADADPDVLGRVANIFNVANLAPRRVVMQREGNDLVVIALDMGPINNQMAEGIHRKIAQLTCVHIVKMTRKGAE